MEACLADHRAVLLDAVLPTGQAASVEKQEALCQRKAQRQRKVNIKSSL